MSDKMSSFFILSLFLLISISSAATFQSIVDRAKAPKHVQDILYNHANQQNKRNALSTYLSNPTRRSLSWHFMKDTTKKFATGVVNTRFKKGYGVSTISNPVLQTIKAVSRKGGFRTKSSALDSDSIHESKLIVRSAILPLIARQSGFTGDVCSSSEDCVGPRVCIDFIANASRCILVQGCDTDIDCVADEFCASAFNNNISGRICISKNLVGGNSDSSPCGLPTPSSVPTRAPEPSGGLTGDFCNSTSDCAGSRTCVEDVADASRCIPFELQDCETDTDCVTGEFCATVDETSFCVSEALLEEDVEVSPSPTSPPMSETDGGLTGDVCSSSIDCVGSRQCIDDIANASRCIPSDGLQSCNSDNNCVTGEVCVTSDGNSFCISEALVEEDVEASPSPISTPMSETEGGLTADVCSSSIDCVGSRQCIDNIANASRCVPSDGLQTCNSDNDCVTGEVCVVNTETGQIFCVSEAALNDSSPSPSPTPPSKPSGGLTGDVCTSSVDCLGSRTCVEASAAASRCIPSELQDCDTDSDCVTGEICETPGVNFCVSEAALNNSSPRPSPTPPGNPSGGLSGDICTSTSDCEGTRTCIEVIAGVSRCIPFELRSCRVDFDCVTGEVCVTNVVGNGVCLSAAFVGAGPSSSTTDMNMSSPEPEATEVPFAELHAMPDPMEAEFTMEPMPTPEYY